MQIVLVLAVAVGPVRVLPLVTLNVALITIWHSAGFVGLPLGEANAQGQTAGCAIGQASP